MLKALEVLGLAAAIIDRDGFVIAANAHAERIFDPAFHIRIRRLYAVDPHSRQRLNKLTSHIRNGGDVKRTRTVVVRLGRLPIVIDSVIGLEGDTDSGKNDALLLLTDLEERRVVSPHSTEEVFGLTATQARVASLLAEGSSLAEIARDIGIPPGTARNHLKAVFARTGTRRQGELVSLLSRLR